MTQRTREEFGRDCKTIARNVDLNQFSYQLKKTRRPERKLPIPDFATTDKLQSALIRRMYPKFETNQHHREQAALYNLILYLYYRQRLTARSIAGDLNSRRNPSERVTTGRVERIIQECRFAAAGLRRSGKPRTNGKRGPKIRVLRVISHESEIIFDESNQHVVKLQHLNH